ncbi:MAG: hypothetical protein IJK78_11695 [Bacteroidales bacterium]|nr:hypothetical protein [Bacteroidales bacterium]
MKEDENFTKFSEDIVGNKKTVLFVGAGVNYSKHNPMTWPYLLKHLTDHALVTMNATDEERQIVKQAFLGNPNNETVESLKLLRKADQLFPVEVKASIVKQLLGDANCRIFKMDAINLFVPNLDDTMRFNVRKEDGMIVFDVDTPTEISTMKDYWRKTVNAALI